MTYLLSVMVPAQAFGSEAGPGPSHNRPAAAHTYLAAAGHRHSFPPHSSNPSYHGLATIQVYA